MNINGKLTEESMSMGASTMVQLQDQKEQFDRIEAKIDGSSRILAVAQHHVSSMSSYFYSWFKKAPTARYTIINNGKCLILSSIMITFTHTHTHTHTYI